MSPPVVNAKAQWSGDTLPAPQEPPSTRKTAGRRAGKQPPAKQPPAKQTVKGQNQPKNASPSSLSSGMVGCAGSSTPATITLPDVPLNSPAAVFLSGTNAQDQNGVCSAQPPQPAGQAIPASAAPNTAAAPSLSVTEFRALIANWHSVDDAVKVPNGLTGPDQQQEAAYVVKQALLRFDALDDVRKLAEAVKNNSALRPILVEQILHRAAELEAKSTSEDRDRPDGPHHQACAYVLAALKIMDGEALGTLVSQKFSAKEGELLAKTLDVKHPSGANGILSPVRHQLLSALNSVPRTATTSAVVKTLYLLLLPEDTIIYCRPLAESLAEALAREEQPQSVAAAAAEKNRYRDFLLRPEGAALMLTGTEEKRQRVFGVLQKYNFTVDSFAQHSGPWVTQSTFAHDLAEGMIPADAPNRAALVYRIGDILSTEQGQEIRFGWYGVDKKINLEARTEAMQAIIDNKITAEILQQTKDPWQNPVLVKAIAAKRIAGIEAKFPVDVPHKFRTREELTAFVAITAGLPLHHPRVKLIVNQLIRQGGSEPVVSFQPTFFSSIITGVVQFPLYRTDVLYSFGQGQPGHNPMLHKFGQDEGGRNLMLQNQISVDDMGQFYRAEARTSAYKMWQGTNVLPSGVVVSLKGGRISRDQNGAPALEVTDTPEKGRGGEKIATAALMVGGIFAGGWTLLGEGGSLFVSGMGGVSSLWGAGSAVAERQDRASHGQSNAWSDPAGRAVNLSLAASIASLGMIGVGPALQETIYAGELTHEMALLSSVVNTAGAVTDGAAVANGVVELIKNYKDMKADDVGLALSQMGWQAIMSGVGIVQAGGLGRVFNPMAGARALIAEHMAPPTVHYGSIEVEGNAVEIRQVKGGDFVVFVGPQAVNDKVRIDHHIDLANKIAKTVTFPEMVGKWLGRGGMTEAESIAIDIEKLTTWIIKQNARLENSTNLTHDERTAIVNDIAECIKRTTELANRSMELAENPRLDRGAQAILLPDSTGQAHGGPTPEQFMSWLGSEHSEVLGEAKAALRQHGIDIDQMGHGGGDPYRGSVGSNPDSTVDNIVAWIVGSKKGWFGNDKYREIYSKYMDMVDARVSELNRLRSSPAGHSHNRSIPRPSDVTNPVMVGSRTPEFDFGDWLFRRYPAVFKEATKAAGYDVDKIMRWLVQSKKYRLGVDPTYNEIFGKYFALNNTRLQEMHAIESAPPVDTTPWVIDPLTHLPVQHQPGTPAPPPVEPILYRPGEQAEPVVVNVHPSPDDDVPPTVMQGAHPSLLDDPRNLVFASRENTGTLVNHLFAAVRDESRPNVERFIDKLRTRIGAAADSSQPLTVQDFLNMVYRFANQDLGPTVARNIWDAMAYLGDYDPSVISSGQLRPDSRLDHAQLLTLIDSQP